jgi:hypothetical protein
MAEADARDAAQAFALSAVQKLAKILLPIGFGVGDLIHAAKRAFVSAAEDHIRARGDRVSTSSIAVITGLSRADVAKIRANRRISTRLPNQQRAERVMHGWFTSSKFVDASGNPLSLSRRGTPSFAQLVLEFGGDVPPRAVLRELLAGGMVRIGPDGSVSPVTRHYAAATRSTSNLQRIAADTEIFFDTMASASEERVARRRRISVEFSGRIPAAVKRNVETRTERFVDALSEYLHSASANRHVSRAADDSTTVFHVLIASCERDET